MNNINKKLVKEILSTTRTDKDINELYNIIQNNLDIIDIDKNLENNKTRGEKIADSVSKILGSWYFVIMYTIFIIGWIIINTIYIYESFDPYPFILLNLTLSILTSLEAPIILMSQNRSAKKDSIRNEYDYKIDLKSEILLEDIHNKLDELLKQIKK